MRWNHHWERILGSGNGICKGPEVGVKLADRKVSTMASGVHERQGKGELKEMKVREGESDHREGNGFGDRELPKTQVSSQ